MTGENVRNKEAQFNTLILINPKARLGSDGAQKIWEKVGADVMDALVTSGVRQEQAKIHWTTSGADVSKSVGEFLKTGGRKIVVIGGDGTLSEAVHGAFFGLASEPGGAGPGKTVAAGDPRHSVGGHVPEFFVLPAGRGNDFFKTMLGRRLMNHGEAWELGLQILRVGHTRPVDIGLTQWRVNGELQPPSRAWINIASFGFPGLVVKRVFKKGEAPLEHQGRRSKTALTYLDSSLSSLFAYRPIRFHIRVDEKDLFDGNVFSGFVLGGRFNAGGVCWSQSADPGDGFFEILVQEPKNIALTLLDLPRYWTGRWERAHAVHRARGKVVEIFKKSQTPTDHPLFEVDGDLNEPPGCDGARFELLPHAIQMGCLQQYAP